jgi:hypothetical protein
MIIYSSIRGRHVKYSDLASSGLGVYIEVCLLKEDKYGYHLSTTRLLFPDSNDKESPRGLAQGVQIATIDYFDLTPPDARLRKPVEMHARFSSHRGASIRWTALSR